MMEFDNLKNSYMFSIQAGLAAKIDYHDCKFANDFIHKFCEFYIDNSRDKNDKATMKQELKLLKETLSNEIESFYRENHT